MSSHLRSINDIIARSLELESEGKGKLLPLKEAIRRYVKPGMKLHLACGLSGPSAAICEIIRQYWGKNPEFILIQSILAGHVTNLIHGKLAKKLIFTVSAGSGKSRKEIQRAFAEKTIEFENWSLCSLQQRLMAGALGVSFMPTRSIIGSSMASDNQESFREIEDPFGSKTNVGIIKALNPDISIVHGCVSDVCGNTITPAPYGDDIWGPLASTNGVLVTVEKIVPTALIRKYSALVKIPGHIVNAVSVAPLGVHPFALPNPGISEFDAYGGDREFLQGLHTASTDEKKIAAWIKEWVLDCPTHEHYLKKLGSERINALRGVVTRGFWDYDYSFASPPPAANQDYTQEEITPIVAAREIIRSVKKSQHRTILAGAGAGLIAAWLAYYQLRAGGYEIELIQGNGQIGYLPQPAESLLRSGAGAPSAKMMTDAIITHGVFVGGKNNKCISLLGAGEIDKYGNINSTRTSSGLFLSGSGGGNDAANAQEVMVVLEQSRQRFVQKLPFITCPGGRVTTVISTMGVFKKSIGRAELRLTACFPNPAGASLEEQIKQVQDNCGWRLGRGGKVREVPRPTRSELELLRSLLPASLA
jgi:acyl CoA:acetate/3-ketoacid CoA transferase alpha subunit/acyl CoA:acetate/3-ketoacid CoA transferase beta subunit